MPSIQEESKTIMINTCDEKKPPEDSYEVISDDESMVQEAFVNLDQRDLELEILSKIDPNDEFLQSERSFLLIEGVSDAGSDFTVLGNQSSDFSIISGSRIHQVLN